MLYVIEEQVDPAVPSLGWRPSMEPDGTPRAFVRKADMVDSLRGCEQRGKHTGIKYRWVAYWRKEGK